VVGALRDGLLRSVARWLRHASLFGALKAGAGGCDCPCVWTMLLCGL
jgi:hypothetical protein